MYFLQWYFRSNTASGKTRQQCEKANASCIREGSIKLACHPPYRRTQICPPQRCILGCPLLTIRLATFPSTISLHLWPALHSRACTNLHLWWIPFNLPQWAKEHHGWVPHWNMSQCSTTSITHRRISCTRISKQGGWGPSRHSSWQLLGKKLEARIFWHMGVEPPSLRVRNTFLSQCYIQEKRAEEKIVW